MSTLSSSPPWSLPLPPYLPCSFPSFLPPAPPPLPAFLPIAKTSRLTPNYHCLLVLIGLCTSLPSSVGGAWTLLLTSRIWQMWWDITSLIGYIKLQLLSLLVGLNLSPSLSIHSDEISCCIGQARMARNWEHPSAKPARNWEPQSNCLQEPDSATELGRR